jgi:long-chain-fatty-acid--CoA ligase ACSBG
MRDFQRHYTLFPVIFCLKGMNESPIERHNPSNMSQQCLLSSDGIRSLTQSTDGEGLYWTADPSRELPVIISTDPSDVGSLRPITVMEAFQASCSVNSERTALKVERNNHWKTWTYAQYYQDVTGFAKSLIAVGMQPFECVNIIGFNAPEWFIADIGTIFAGGIVSGIYTTNGPESCHYVANHSKAKVVVVEDQEQLDKFLSIRDRLPHLTAIVQYIGTPQGDDLNGVYSWQEFMALGGAVDDDALQTRIAAQRPGNCCTLIYTSGTTGTPKAVMLSHDNVTWTARAMLRAYDLGSSDEVIVTYLPLSHIAAQMADMHGPMMLGATVAFARPDALRGSLVETLNAVRPTIFFGVPRVWEKIEEKMRDVGRANTGVKKAFGDWAKTVGLAGNTNRLKGESVPWGWTLASAAVFKNVQKALGLDRCNIRITGAAPITKQTVEYFMSLDMSLAELYGMSESSGPGTLSLPGRTQLGSVGVAMNGTQVVIDQPDAKGEGEILMGGRHVFMGYMFNAEATAGTFTKHGLLKSGDVGRLDEDGFLKITGRIKELIITAGGENVAPVPIEDAVKAELPCVSNIMVIGDKRKFLSALITLKTEPDPATGAPTQTLAGAVREFTDAKTSEEAMRDQKLITVIQEGIARANAKAVSRAQRVSKWTMLPDDFSVQTNELTPTMKLKRRVVATKYGATIETMYESEAHPSKL